ncbi:MAG: hypothetical protein FWG85_07420 [Bacteroidetes bacterium]|nr:hypothetical protein [Bacteroidota bacterium]
MFNLEFAPKYLKNSRYLVKKKLINVLEKVIQVEDILEDGSWLQPNIKSQYKIEKFIGYKNIWKCKYIYGWRIIFVVDNNIITLIDLDRRDTIYTNFN